MKNHLNKIKYLFAVGLLFPLVLFAQKPNYKFKSVKQHEGLINGTVQTIFEDSWGFIWLGTQHGLQRYNGNTYKNYEQSDNDTLGLSQNYINDFCEDGDGNLWIATSGGLNKYNRKTDKVERYFWQNRALKEKSGENLTCVVVDQQDAHYIWVNSFDGGLIKLNVRDGSTEVYPAKNENDTWLQWILPYPGQDHKLLLGGAVLYAFDKNTGHFDEIFALEQNHDVPDNLINDAVIDPSDQQIIWLGTGDYWGRGSYGGLIRLNMNTGESEMFSPETIGSDFPDRHILQICFNGKNNLWLGTRNTGALLYKINENRFYNYRYNEYDEGSFCSENAVRSMLVDKSGTMWFGTWGDGLSLLSPTAQKFQHFKHLPGDDSGLSDNYVNAFAEDKNGNIWIATKAGGLNKFNPANNSFEHYFTEFTISEGRFTEITYLYYDSRNNLWIGTYDDALYRFNPETGQKLHYEKGKSPDHISQKRISAITEFKPGNILISTYGGGLNIYSYQTNSFRQYMHNPDDSTSIPDNQIWLPFLADDGNYYFGGNSVSVIIRFDPETEIFTEITPANAVTSFQMPAKTAEGRIFINDVTVGLREVKVEDEIIVSTMLDTRGEGIKNVESVVVDGENKLWMGTGNGLVAFDPDTRISKMYDVGDGLQGYNFNRFAGFKSSDGEMYFGGTNGFNVFNPNKIKLSNYQPPIVFTDFKLFLESVPIGETSPLKQNILLMDKLMLDYNQNDFSFLFAALDFSNPKKVMYKYILENQDADWINAGRNNTASYTNMDPGEYTFKVMATNGDGVWNKELKSIQLTINPPWWLTKWAYAFYLLLFAAGVFAFDRFMRNRLIRKERERTKEKELEQAREIEKAYNKLKATQSQLIQSEKMASLGELTAGIAHEIQNPLNFVNNFSEVSEELVMELKEELTKGDVDEAIAISDDVMENLNKINHHGKRADAIVKGMLQHSRVSSGIKEPTDLNALADEYLRLSYHGLRAKDKSFNADFKTEFDADLPKIDVVPQDIGRVLLNLINNAFHAVKEKTLTGFKTLSELNRDESYKPTVTVTTKNLGDKIEIRVKDNGPGIPDEIKDKVFQPFFTTKPTGEGTGLGLSMSYDIITKGHGGELKVNSKGGDGTEFIIMLPSR